MGEGPATPEASPQPAAPAPERAVPNALQAFGVLIGCLFAQLVGGYVVGLWGGVTGTERTELAPATALAGMVLQAVALLWMLAPGRFQWLRGPVWADEGRRASWNATATAAVVGVAVASFYVVIFTWLVPPDPDQPTGPLSEMAQTPGAPRAAWTLVALLLAPPIEELIYRGVLLAGLERSWGRGYAVAGTTFIFLAAHAAETIHYWPANLAVGALGLGTALVRIRTGSLGPAIAMHFGYNTTMALVVHASGTAAASW